MMVIAESVKYGVRTDSRPSTYVKTKNNPVGIAKENRKHWGFRARIHAFVIIVNNDDPNGGHFFERMMHLKE